MSLKLNTAEMQSAIEAVWEERQGVNQSTTGVVRDTVEAALDLLDKGEVRSVVQHTNLVAGARQPPDDPGSQESASASNENSHVLSPLAVTIPPPNCSTMSLSTAGRSLDLPRAI